MSKYLSFLIVAVSISVAQCRVTFTYSEVLQETDLDASKTAKFKCDNGCVIYSSSLNEDMWITDGAGTDMQNFWLMGKPDKGTVPIELVKWDNYRLEWKGDGAPPKFVFYAVDKKSPNLDDIQVHAAAGEFSFGFTGGSAASRRFTILGYSDPVPLFIFDGEFADGYPRIYATGYDAVDEDACSPVYQARSLKSAINSQLTFVSPILTVDKGPAKGKASVQVKTSGAVGKKPTESSVVYKSPGYVGCSNIKNQIYSSASDTVLDNFSSDAKSLDFYAYLNIPTASESVKITVNNGPVDLYGTTPISKHFEADKFDVTISWIRSTTTTSSFAIQFDLGIPNNGETKTTVKMESTTTKAPDMTTSGGAGGTVALALMAVFVVM